MSDIIVIGGINIDIEGRPNEKLKERDSNPGKVKISFGGVGRNIAENLARLGADVSMISLTGDDYLGHDAIEQLGDVGVDTSHIECIKGESTGIYLSILDHMNDLNMGICNMDILQKITPAFIDNIKKTLNEAKVVAIDCNLTYDTLDYITTNIKVPLFLETISSPKAEKVKDIIGRFDTIKPNHIEAEVLTGIKIKDMASLKAAGANFIDKGVKNVFISLGEYGIYYNNGEKEGIVPTRAARICSATGAGDSVCAAILYGMVNDLDIEEIANYGMICASITLESYSAVNTELSIENIKEKVNRL